MLRSAMLSPDEAYRYALTRSWAEEGRTRQVCFVGLNPSTADASIDDPTIRRCIRFARDWGYNSLAMVNLFAYRATDPRVMQAAADPVGPDNDKYLLDMAHASDLVVCCWGAHGHLLGRGDQVRRLLAGLDEMGIERQLHHLGLTKDGHPRHPLYLPAATLPASW